MSDHDEFRLEPSEGQRTGGSPGERLVVGLAGFALLAGLLIALGNLIGQRAEVSSANSPTPGPTASRSPIARTFPAPRLLREITLQPGSPGQHPTQAIYFNGWIRANADLVVRANPQPEAIQLSVLAQGAVAFAEELPDRPPGDLGWLHVQAPQPEGWIATREGGTELVERIRPPEVPVSGDIWTMAGGGHGLLAVGSNAGLSNQSLPPLVALSADGARWRAAELPPALNYGFVAGHGPAGWLALAAISEGFGESVWVWQSTDGLRWTALGKMSDQSDLYPSAIVSSSSGYMLATSTGSAPETIFWFSEDGITWRETADARFAASTSVRLAGGPDGFYAWDSLGRGPGDKGRAAYSADGRTWAPMTGGPEGPTAQVVAVGPAWVGTDAGSATGVRRLWAGEVEGNRLRWHREPPEAVFESAVVSTLVSDGRRAIAFGWDRPTERPMAWIREGRSWVRSPLPDAFGGLPRIAAGGLSGVAVVGYRPTLRGPNPIVWHLAADGSWTTERDPFLPVAADPSRDECGPAPSNAVDFVVLDPAAAVTCLGNMPLTFRVWSPVCPDCFGEASPGSGTPGWLATPGTNLLAISPVEGSDPWFSSVVLGPSLQKDPAWTASWLDVTGHFDDPAATGCRLTPPLEEELYYTGRQSVVDGCRQQFVVTSVTPVPGP